MAASKGGTDLMAWGRLDDGFYDHPKVVALLDEDDQTVAGVAIGLWTLCWSWAHRNTRKPGKTPGLLPSGLPRRFLGAVGKDAAQLLVKHKLWDPQEDGGWFIHDFDQFLPSDEIRMARSEAGRRGAEKRWGARDVANDPDPDGNLPSACHDSCYDDDGNAIATDSSRAGARRDPTPIPIPINQESLLATGGALPHTHPKKTWESKDIDSDPKWIEFWDAYPSIKSKGAARTAWIKALRKGVDPDTLINGARAYRNDRNRGKDFTKHASTWLNAECWGDYDAEIADPVPAGPRPFWEN